MALAAAIVPGLLLGLGMGQVSVLDIGLRTEGRARGRNSQWVAETETSPRLGLGLSDREVNLVAAYQPRLFTIDNSTDIAVLHRGQADLAWRLSRLWTLRSSANGSIGTNDFLLDSRAGGGTSGAAPLPGASRLGYVSAAGSVSLDGSLDRGVTTRLNLAAQTDGGRDAVDQQKLPRTLGARLGGLAEWSVSRQDAVTSNVGFSVGRVLVGQVDFLTSVGGTWRHRFKPPSHELEPEELAGTVQPPPRERPEPAEIWIGGGVALDAQRNPRTVSWETYPTAEIGIRQRLHQTLDLSLAGDLVPEIDRYAGSTSEGVGLTGTVGWKPPKSGFSIALSGTGRTVVLGTRSGERAGGASLQLTYGFFTAWSATLGFRGWWQNQSLVPAFSDVSSFLAVTYGDRVLF